MAAPSGIKWGSTVGSYGKIGIYVKLTETATQVDREVQVWFASKYSVSDTNNTFYYNCGTDVTKASSSKGSVSIKTTVDTGSGWSGSNHKKLKTYNHTYTKGTSAVTYKIYAKLANIDRVGGTMNANTSFTIPALAKYTISYNANGGTGAPAAQTKWYGSALTLSGTKPTRPNYIFKGWSTSAGGSVVYGAGESYTSNANVTLYAVWQGDTYSVSYDLKGGTGTSTKQTYTYGGSNIFLHAAPKKTNYNFLGWSLSSTATTGTYYAGQEWSSKNANNYTLYAVWELAYIPPKITNLSILRCNVNENGEVVLNDEGTNAFVKFNWECDPLYEATEISIRWKLTTETSFNDGNKKLIENVSGVSGSVEVPVGNELIDADHTYDFLITVTDTNDHNNASFTLPSTLFVIDMLGGGKGVAFGKAAEHESLADFAFQANFGGGIKNQILEDNVDLDTKTIPNIYAGSAASSHGYQHCPITTATSFTLEVMSAGGEGQLMQRITACSWSAPVVYVRHYYSSKWGDWVTI